MEFLKPMGRQGKGRQQPTACMCSTVELSATPRRSTWTPPCLHCGCGCGGKGEYRTGNRAAAAKHITADY